jgi:DMSO/TMAO reductase YedYZ molybdopterin-dependent catalytic subunit
LKVLAKSIAEWQSALVAVFHDGESISTEHGDPARLIAPKLRLEKDQWGML